MNVSRRPLLARAIAVGAIGLASLLGAATANAEYDPWDIPLQETVPGSTDPVLNNHCAKLEIVYARGTAEPAGNSWALNGYNYANWHGTDPTGSSAKSPYSVFYTVARALGNKVKLADGSLKAREYVTVYPDPDNPTNPGTEKTGRSDFALWHVPYPADLSFTYDWSHNNSIQKGTRALINHLNAEIIRCPSKKFMLFAYSQGSLVVGNVISNPADRKYIYNSYPLPTISTNAINAIATVGLMADAGFNSTEKLAYQTPGTPTGDQYDRWRPTSTYVTAKTPWNIDADTYRDIAGRRHAANIPLTGTVRGQLEAPLTGPQVGKRSNNWMLPRFIDRIRSYCILADPICNRSSTDANAHLLYFNTQVPRQNTAIFAVQRLRRDDTSWNSTNWSGIGVGFPYRLAYDPALDSTINP